MAELNLVSQINFIWGGVFGQSNIDGTEFVGYYFKSMSPKDLKILSIIVIFYFVLRQ